MLPTVYANFKPLIKNDCMFWNSCTLTSMSNLVSMYWNQGRWKEAEELNVRVKEGGEHSASFYVG